MIRILNIADRKRQDWRLKEGTHVIGRGADCDLYIDDDTISRKHAQIEIADKQNINLTDLGSHNGTLVNEKRITGSVPLKHNDLISLGRIVLRIVIDEIAEKENGLADVFGRYDDLSNATILSMDEALKPLPSGVLENPGVFNAISEVGKMLIMPGDDRQMLEKSIELLQNVIPVERVAILLTGESEKDIRLSVCRIDGETRSRPFDISKTILNEVLTQEKAILISDPRMEEKFAEQHSIISARIKSAMAVPLYDEGKISGILYADTTNPAHHYSEDYLRITAMFANILAAKMTNNSLLNERRAKEILESELAVASQIQEQLLPGTLPAVDGYSLEAFQIQCKHVGGDLYDVATLEDGRVLFVLADVSGKGMGAALLASNILASFRVLYNTKEFDLLDATRNVSRQLLAFTRPGDFATLFVGLLDPVSDSLHYVNAGHNPPIVIRSNGEPEHLEASGIPVGMMSYDQWKEESVTFDSGDTLFAFTDGIPEAMNSDDIQFSDERLEKLAVRYSKKKPKQFIDSIMNEVYEFIGEQPRSDDITMIVLRRD